MRDSWYYAEGEKPVGPLSFDALATLLRKISNPGEVNVWHTGLDEWHAARDVPEIADLLYLRPPPIPQQILTRPLKAQPADGGVANSGQNKTLGRIGPLMVLALVLFVGTIFSTIIYDNIGLIQKFLHGLAARESKTALQDGRDLTPIDSALEQNMSNGLAAREGSAASQGGRDPTSIEQNPSNVLLQLMPATSKPSLESGRLTQKLSEETKASVLDKDIDLATASRAELEAIHRDLETAEANATMAMSRNIALLKEKREKTERFVRSLRIDDQTKRDFLDGADNRHAEFAAFASRIMLARAELYRTLGNALTIVIGQIGDYEVESNGQLVFSSSATADRYNAAASEIEPAAKHVAELEAEEKKLIQSEQEGWERFVSGE